ncbi:MULTISPECIES: hypothetical protein [Fischerella]|uniref:Uncharacterized protein n=1 Tax=Fischerella muscicola CCMEE 5323 TaxID=2019572 RepID=A0A2N6K8M0_FISMU|nr:MULTISPECIES: hypothetical protein [Fischerella]MBD2434147.1 hypothetical protein [Fischerella sp. FACHB-380]PLZ93974.1 hypothetical protein CEN44_01765 [Fischerella muscicola CCMEE 5323]
MAIQLHGFTSSGKRYIQVQSQPHHITGIFRKMLCFYGSKYESELMNTESTYFECQEDGTITFYQAVSANGVQSGIWTYLVYECAENEEKVFRDKFIDTNIISLRKLLAGQKLVEDAVGIYEYLKYKFYETEFLDVLLPADWDNLTGKAIANILLEEYQAFRSSSLFAEDVGKKYMNTVINKFIQLGREVLETGSTITDFELRQYDVLKNVKINEIANLIIEYNDYRLWQSALPSKSKAVEYAFSAALDLICRIK